MYAPPAQMFEAQHLFNYDITKTIADHFGSLTVEIVEGCLYVYAEHQRPSVPLLEKMIKYGSWLAGAIDERVKEVR